MNTGTSLQWATAGSEEAVNAASLCTESDQQAALLHSDLAVSRNFKEKGFSFFLPLEAKKALLTATGFRGDKCHNYCINTEDSPGNKGCSNILKPHTPVCQINLKLWDFFHVLPSTSQHNVNIWVTTATSE